MSKKGLYTCKREEKVGVGIGERGEEEKVGAGIGERGEEEKVRAGIGERGEEEKVGSGREGGRGENNVELFLT